MLKIFVSSFLTAGLKVFALSVYAVWGAKILLAPDDPNILFNLLALLLSIIGLWFTVSRLCEWIERTIERGRSSTRNG
jgi:hypothetical protein